VGERHLLFVSLPVRRTAAFVSLLSPVPVGLDALNLKNIFLKNEFAKLSKCHSFNSLVPKKSYVDTTLQRDSHYFSGWQFKAWLKPTNDYIRSAFLEMKAVTEFVPRASPFCQ